MKIKRLLRNETGASFFEGIVVFPIVLLTFSALVEFGFASFQWNQTVKALQLGARQLAVSNMLVSAADASALTADYPGAEGGPTPPTPVSVSCGAGASACIPDEIQRLVRGSDNDCDPEFGNGIPGICDFNNRILEENIRVTYQRTGLGYVGRPAGPIVTIIIEARDVNFELPIMGALFGLDDISIPANPITITSEDLSNCSAAC
ncbi:MAG: TadE/TadG family type IV pilus assembly protein [Rhizobiaceae bacterium]